MQLSRNFLLIPLSIAGALADFVGSNYPAPVDLTSNTSHVSAAWENLTSIFDAYLIEGNTTADSTLVTVENLTFSVGLFSLHDPAVNELQYHYTGPQIANAQNGTNKVDGDSIYRVASVSKLFTVFAGMISLTNEDWNRPLTDIIPGLRKDAGRGEQSPVYNIQWDKITPWALAVQSAGVPGTGSPLGDLIFQEASPTTTFGFPAVNTSSWGPCWNGPNIQSCSVDEYIENIRSYPPSFLPWTTPAYSNDGFILLGIAISNIMGEPMEVVYRKYIFEPLGMTSSNSSYPTGEAELARSVIAGDPNLNFAANVGILTPTGGLLSTINDLAKFGLAILNSTLVPPDVTRKWIKPATHTASLTYSVGAPWEIMRYIHPSTGKVTDLYTKLGDSGYYSGIVVLIPDYGAGFSLLSAQTNSSIRANATNRVLDHVTNAILPALEAQAQAEVDRNFAGSYISTDSSLNSSVTIAFNESTVFGAPPALSVTSWISNGTDVLLNFFYGIKPRLLLSIPNQSPKGAAGKVAFQASLAPQTNSYFAAGASELGVIGPFTGSFNTNFDWFFVDSARYAKIGVNLFVFDLDDKGRATAVSPAVTRVTLKRKE